MKSVRLDQPPFQDCGFREQFNFQHVVEEINKSFRISVDRRTVDND